MKGFNYIAPASLAETLDFLSEADGRAQVMAGGTDLLVEMRSQKIQLAHIIDLKKIPGLEFISYHPGEGLRLGSLARVRDIETSKAIRQRFPMLATAAGYLGSVQVRNRATVGGNLCHASPSAEMAPPLIALGARVIYRGPGGENSILLEDFFVGPGQTVLKKNEVLTEIFIPEIAGNTDGVYLKFSPRRAMDLAIVGVATTLTTDTSGMRCEDARIVLGAVAPTPIRAQEAEGVLRGKELNVQMLRDAGKTASREARPITDIRASEWYRRQIVEVLTVRAVEQTWERIRKTKEAGIP